MKKNQKKSNQSIQRGGKRIGAGRKAGVRNKKTAKLIEAVEASGETPLDYMLRVLRDPTVDHRRRDAMAGQAAPYVHAKLASVTVAGDQDKPINMIHRVERVIVRPTATDSGSVRAAPGTE